jgi:hypothetical protein
MPVVQKQGEGKQVTLSSKSFLFRVRRLVVLCSCSCASPLLLFSLAIHTVVT